MKFNRSFKFLALSCSMFLLQSIVVIPTANAAPATNADDSWCDRLHVGQQLRRHAMLLQPAATAYVLSISRKSGSVTIKNTNGFIQELACEEAVQYIPTKR